MQPAALHRGPLTAVLVQRGGAGAKGASGATPKENEEKMTFS
jgi:hypothetical protein